VPAQQIPTDARTHLWRALDLHHEAGDVVGQAHTHIKLAMTWWRAGNSRDDQPHADKALDQARHALELYRTAGHRWGEANALNAVGWFQVLLGRPQEAISPCRAALALLEELDLSGRANTWDSIAYAHHLLGQHTEAITCYQHSLDLYRRLGDRFFEADIISYLGDAYHAVGQPELARAAWREALVIFDGLDHPDAERVRTQLVALDSPPPRTR